MQVPWFTRRCMARLLCPYLGSLREEENCVSEPVPKPDSSPSLASLLRDEVCSWSFLKSNVDRWPSQQPACWCKHILTQILDFLLPSVCHAPIPQCTAMALYTFNPTAAYKSSPSQLHFLVMKCCDPLSTSVRGQLGLWTVCDRRATLWPQKNSLWRQNKTTLQVMRRVRFCCWEAGGSMQGTQTQTDHFLWCKKVGEERRNAGPVKAWLCSAAGVWEPSWEVWAVAEE